MEISYKKNKWLRLFIFLVMGLLINDAIGFPHFHQKFVLMKNKKVIKIVDIIFDVPLINAKYGGYQTLPTIPQNSYRPLPAESKLLNYLTGRKLNKSISFSIIWEFSEKKEDYEIFKRHEQEISNKEQFKYFGGSVLENILNHSKVKRSRFIPSDNFRGLIGKYRVSYMTGLIPFTPNNKTIVNQLIYDVTKFVHPSGPADQLLAKINRNSDQEKEWYNYLSKRLEVYRNDILQPYLHRYFSYFFNPPLALNTQYYNLLKRIKNDAAPRSLNEFRVGLKTRRLLKDFERIDEKRIFLEDPLEIEILFKLFSSNEKYNAIYTNSNMALTISKVLQGKFGFFEIYSNGIPRDMLFTKKKRKDDEKKMQYFQPFIIPLSEKSWQMLNMDEKDVLKLYKEVGVQSLAVNFSDIDQLQKTYLYFHNWKNGPVVDGEKKIWDLIKLGDDKNIDFLGTIFNVDGEWTFTHLLSIEKEFLPYLNIIIKKGAPINPIDDVGRTPLHYAVEQGNLWAIKYLIYSGADKNIKDKEGKKAIDLTKNQQIKKILKSKRKALREELLKEKLI